jgi:hypothetical protein
MGQELQSKSGEQGEKTEGLWLTGWQGVNGRGPPIHLAKPK